MTFPIRPLLIAVVGGSRAGKEACDLAYEVGRHLAKRGAALVCGGLTGVMEAACKGAYEAGGLTIGILPGLDPSDANPYVRIPVCTGIGYARNLSVVRSGRAVIAVDGSYGTLSEIAHALGDGIPVVGLKTWKFFQDGSEEDTRVVHADTPEDAVAMAIALAKERDATLHRSKDIPEGSGR
jgi:uncharacterized protein (TIGR00725 family)